MKHFFVLVGVLLIAAVVACPTEANEGEDVQSLVENAIAKFKDAGRAAAIKAINDKQGPFVEGKLYVFALSMDNVMVAHPHEHSLRGVSLNSVKDATGAPIFQRFKEVVETQSSGWVEYQWAKPGAKDPSPKKSFVKRSLKRTSTCEPATTCRQDRPTNNIQSHIRANLQLCRWSHGQSLEVCPLQAVPV